MQMLTYASARNINPLLNLSACRYRVGGKFCGENCARVFLASRGARVTDGEIRGGAPSIGQFCPVGLQRIRRSISVVESIDWTADARY